jgi:hypothetical protein
MVPVFAVGCLIIEWAHARRKGISGLGILRTQLLIWLGMLVATFIIYILLFNGRLNYENTGLIMILLLALTTYFSGIILDYRLCLLGISLASILIIVSFLEEYMWVVLIIGTVGLIFIFHNLSKIRWINLIFISKNKTS